MSDSSDPMDCSLPGSSSHGILQWNKELERETRLFYYRKILGLKQGALVRGMYSPFRAT